MVVRFSSTFLPFSSISFYSILVRSFLFFGRCDFRRHHGATAAHGCSPRYIFYGVVLGEHSCQLHCMMTGVYGWFCSWDYSFTTSPVASDSEDDDDDDGDDDDAFDDADGDASSIDEMSTWHFTLCHSWQNGGVVLDMKVVTLRGRVSFWIIVLGEVLFLFEGCSEDAIYLFFSFFFRYIVLVHEVLWPFIDIYCTYFLFYDVDVCFSFTYPFICCFFSPFIHMLLIICMQSIISVSHKDALMSFV